VKYLVVESFSECMIPSSIQKV